MPDKGSHAENTVIKENWYDLKPFKEQIAKYIKTRKDNLGHHSRMYEIYNILYKTIFSGSLESDAVRRYPFIKEMFNVYKSALIEACLPGYSALLETEARNATSVFLMPELKKVMTEQFKSIALIENLTSCTLNDWIMKGEAVAWVKLKQTTERYREKETVTDLETGQDLIQFKVETGVTYEDLVIDPIDPLDFYVDAVDYLRNPKSAVKIIRTYISPRDLLTDTTSYPELSQEDKEAIIQKKAGYHYANDYYRQYQESYSQSKTSENQIEVLTYMGDYVTQCGKLLTNIKVILVEDTVALLEYNGVDTPQIVYAPYFIDRETHRGVSPLACAIPLDDLANRCVDLFISNLDEVSNPIMMYSAGSIPPNDLKNFRNKRELQYNNGIGTKPEWYAPPEISPNGMNLLEVVLNQQKEVLGLNKYMSGDTTGAVRTAQESQILFQKANARMRVETDVFSYRFLLPLMSTFYAFNRELALSVGHPLNDIYANPELMVTISTGASKADTEGETQKLLQVLGMPAISQPIFQWAAESGNMMTAVRYLMAKVGLTDADNILGLADHPELVPPPQGFDSSNEDMQPGVNDIQPEETDGNSAIQQIMNAYNDEPIQEEQGDMLNG